MRLIQDDEQDRDRFLNTKHAQDQQHSIHMRLLDQLAKQLPNSFNYCDLFLNLVFYVPKMS
jgi:hypothetical protein